MKTRIRGDIENSEERTLALARNFTGTNFQSQHLNEYIHAYRNGYLPKLQAILKTKKIKSIEKEKERVLTLAKNYEGKSFSADYKVEFAHARTHGYRNELWGILEGRRRKYETERMRQILKNAFEYKGRIFSKDYESDYMWASRMGHKKTILNILAINKTSQKRALRIAHSKERTFELARSLKGKKFHKQHPLEYYHAQRNGFLFELNEILNNKL